MGKLHLIAVACLPVLAHGARPDRNAYLNTGVSSVAGLVSEVKHDPEVADRYERHFSMTKSELIDMFSHLHVAKLSHDMPVTMYSVPVGGAIKMHHSVMKKGTPVFEDAQGNVVLKIKCGNPVVPGQELTEVSIPETLAPVSVIRNLAPDLVTRPDSNDAIAMVNEPDTTPDVEMKEIVPTPTNVVNNYATTTTTTTYAGSSSVGAGALWGLLPLGALVGVIATEHHGCSCCSNPTPAPEPMSMTMLGVGVAGLALKRRRRQG